MDFQKLEGFGKEAFLKGSQIGRAGDFFLVDREICRFLKDSGEVTGIVGRPQIFRRVLFARIQPDQLFDRGGRFLRRDIQFLS